MLERFPVPDGTLDDLRALVAARAELDAEEARLVAWARCLGYTWSELAEVLGISPQGAAKRHRGSAVSWPRTPDGAEPFESIRPRR